MLELAVPILGALTATPGQVDAQAGMAFFMIGAVHIALMVLVLKVAGAMVAGWSVFGLVPERDDKSAPAQAPQQAAPAAALAQAQAASQASSQARRIDVSAVPTAYAANDSGSSGGSGSRTVKVYATSSATNSTTPASSARARGSGIGSRFKSAAPKALDRSMEKHA